VVAHRRSTAGLINKVTGEIGEGRWSTGWVITYDVASLGLNDVDHAVRLAAANGWLEVEGGHSVRLTDAGRPLANP
jgi:hypothetical protein